MTTTTGAIVEKMVSCPICAGGGCVVCHETGVVKQSNLDRAREPLPEGGWPSPALDRLWRMVVAPVRCRRERTRQQRAWLEANDEPSRLDNADRERRDKERKAQDDGREEPGRAG